MYYAMQHIEVTVAQKQCVQWKMSKESCVGTELVILMNWQSIHLEFRKIINQQVPTIGRLVFKANLIFRKATRSLFCKEKVKSFTVLLGRPLNVVCLGCQIGFYMHHNDYLCLSKFSFSSIYENISIFICYFSSMI